MEEEIKKLGKTVRGRDRRRGREGGRWRGEKDRKRERDGGREGLCESFVKEHV